MEERAFQKVAAIVVPFIGVIGLLVALIVLAVDLKGLDLSGGISLQQGTPGYSETVDPSEPATVPEGTQTQAPEPTEAPTKPPVLKIFYVTARSGLNLRSGPSTDHEPVGLLPHGAGVQLVRQEGGWALVEYEGDQGWVSSQYLSATPMQ